MPSKCRAIISRQRDNIPVYRRQFLGITPVEKRNENDKSDHITRHYYSSLRFGHYMVPRAIYTGNYMKFIAESTT